MSSFQPVRGGSPGRDVTASRVAGALLLTIAGLVLAASFLTLASVNLPSHQLEFRAWVSDSGGVRLLGVELALCSVITGLAGILLIVRARAGSSFALWFAGVGSGSAVGISLVIVLGLASTRVEGGRGVHLEYGAGFWLLALVAVLAVVSVGIGIARPGTPPGDAGRATDRVAGVSLVLAAVLAIGGSYQTVSKYGGSSLPYWFFVLVATGLVAIGAAVMLFLGHGMRNGPVRMSGSVSAGVIFGMALTVVLDTVFNRLGVHIENLELGEGLLVMAVPLSVAAIIASLISTLATPRTPAGPRPPHQPFLPPSWPNHPVSQHFQSPSPRMAKVYDGRGADGRPIVDRPTLNPNTRAAVLAYLESAPVVLSARSLDQDEFAPADRDVPLNFRTDGVWVWSGAVSHYLHKHGVPPEPELVRHIVTRGFQVGEVHEVAKDHAVRLIAGS